MVIYILIWALSLFLSFLPKPSKIIYVLFGIILVFIEGMRTVEVGSDTLSYLNIFETVGNGNYASWVEPVWNLICFISYNFISTNYNVFLLIIASVTIFNFLYVFYKESPNPFLSLYIFISLHMYMGSFNIMRQYLSMSFLLLSWCLLSQYKKRKSIVFLLVSILTHYSTIFSVITYLWKKITLPSNKILYLLIISFIFGSMMNESTLSIFTGPLFANFLEKDTVFRDSSNLMIVMVIAQNMLTMMIVLSVKEEMRENFWFKIFVLSSLVFNATYMVAFAARIYSVFAISQLIFVPLFFKQLKCSRKIASYIVLVIYMSAQFFRILIPNGNGILPYNSVLF